MKPELNLFGNDLFGEPIKHKPAGPLAERFYFPPFSVFDARQGEWQKRKKAWLRMGIKSEIGRTSDLTYCEEQINHPTLNHYRELEKNKKFGVTDIVGDAKTWNDKKRLTWVAGDKPFEQLDEVSRKILAAQPNSGTSIFDPVLCELIYRWYCPENGQIVDPFAGGSVRGIVASKLGLKYWGCDLRQEQIDANIIQGNDLCDEPYPEWICGDAIDTLNSAPQADLIFSCPPYGDLEVYSDNPRDLSTMEYHTFMAALKRIIMRSIKRLKPNGLACFVVGDFRDKRTGNYRGFIADTINAFRENNLQLFNDAILLTQCGSLPLRVSNQFEKNRKLGKTHQNVLIFRR